MIIHLPRGLTFDIDNLPDNFDDQIRQCFKEYTQGTAKDYTYQDKLGFIDRTVELLHNAGDTSDAVYNVMERYFEHEVKEYGNIPDKSDYFTTEFMESCYDHGKRDMSLYSRDYGENKHDDEKIMKIICRVIKTVVDFEWE